MRYSICMCGFLLYGVMAVAGWARAADDSAGKATKSVAAMGEKATVAPSAQGHMKDAPAELPRTVFDVPRQGEIALENVNVRSGPGAGDRVVGILRNGDHVKAVAQIGDWLEIEYPSKFPAWISKDYVDVIKESGDKKGVRIGKINCPKVRIRASGDMTGKVLREATRGEEVTIVGESGLWYKIAAPEGSKCYVHKNCVQLEPPKAATPAGTPEVASRDGHKAEAQKVADESSASAAASDSAAAAAKVEDNKDADVESVTSAQTTAAASKSNVILTSTPKFDPLIPVSVDAGRKTDETKDTARQEEKARLTASVTVKAPKLPAGEGFVSEGIIERQTKYDATVGYRLTKGGITTYYVKASEGVDLEKAVGKLVGVKGRILPPPKGFAHQIILVEGFVAAE